MEASSTTRRRFGGSSRKDLFSSRGGSLALATIVALLAGVVLYAFVQSRNDTVAGSGSGRVLVAKALIPKGSSGDVVAAKGLATATAFSSGEVKQGAIADPSALQGQVAKSDIYPGQQVTADDFVSSGDGIVGKLSGNERAVSVPVDQNHGLIGNVTAGDHIDVLVGFTTDGAAGANKPVLRTLMANVLVLRAPAASANNDTSGSLVLRATDEEAANLAFAADNGKIWVTLRPPAGGQSTRPSTVTLSSLLTGTQPITSGR